MSKCWSTNSEKEVFEVDVSFRVWKKRSNCNSSWTKYQFYFNKKKWPKLRSGVLNPTGFFCFHGHDGPNFEFSEQFRTLEIQFNLLKNLLS